MAAPMGNKFWQNRSTHGRDKLFATPDLLWEAACEYFQWCDDNPWVSVKTSSYDKGEFSGGTTEEKPVQRPYTKQGLCVYIGASIYYLNEFKKKAGEDFLLVVNEIENVIATQQLEGASVGAFNANIIARTLQLVDHTDITTKGKELPAERVKVKFLKKKDE